MNIENAFARLAEAEINGLPTTKALPVENEVVVAPIPASARPIEQAARSLGRSVPNNLWKYRDSDGRLLFAVARWNDANGKKSYFPISWVRGSDGVERFAFRHQATPRPLYGLQDLSARGDAPIVVVEGEECAEVAKAIFPLSVIITSPAGSRWTGEELRNRRGQNPVRPWNTRNPNR
jgi:putative DNA primase/helicase